ncbi:MAG: radical SAM protein [Patescibacteria group bacterium]|nr:radical SAM protein [Patescibacteria group bacterium]
MKQTDVLFVVPGNHKKVFQGLGNDFAAIESPAQTGLFANYLKMIKGCSVGVIDMPALGDLSCNAAAEIVFAYNPILVVMMVYGHQPSASTQNMLAARSACEAIKEKMPDAKILMTGTHPAALPKRTLMEEPIDFVCDGEGLVTIYETLQMLKSGTDDFSKVSNLWYWQNRMPKRSKLSAALITNLNSEFLHGIAWDLLPMEKYRTHNWHCFDNIENRSPYAAIHTSFGCPFSCVFCCINAPFGKSSYRMFSPEHVIYEIDILVNKYNVRNIKFVDELFVLNEEHVNGICDLIIQRGYDLNIWAYARVDTAKERLLDKMRRAGIRWLALGIESGSKHVRDGAKKKFSNEDVINVARKIQNAGIYVGANYIFGLPDDTLETMQETFNLALEINAEWANFYCAMAYPGSKLYNIAKKKELPLPDDPDGPGWIGYSQYSYECLPLPTENLSAADVLRFRDNAFQVYFTERRYLKMISEKFGKKAVEHIRLMTSSFPLKRKILG